MSSATLPVKRFSVLLFVTSLLESYVFILPSFCMTKTQGMVVLPSEKAMAMAMVMVGDGDLPS